MGLRVSYISASMGGNSRQGIPKDGQGRNAIGVSGSMIFNPSAKEAAENQGDDVVFTAHPDAAYIFSGSTSGNDKTLFLGDVTISGTLRSGDGGFVDTDGTGTEQEIAVWLDGNTILGSSSLSYTVTKDDGSDAQLRFNSGLVGNGATGRKLSFRDSAMFIQASADGTLQMEADENLDFNAGAAHDVTVDGGQILLTAAHNVSEAIRLHADAGAAQTIQIINDEGTVDGSEGAGAIDIEATLGGISIHAADDKDIAVEGGQVVLTGNHDTARAIMLHADAGSSQTIQIINDEGTTDGTEGDGAIDIEATLGGISIHAADDKDIWVEGGRAVITANEDAAAAIKLHADAGSSQTIQLLNDAGTASTAIDIEATLGGFSVDGVQASNITVASAGASDDLTIAVTNATDSHLKLQSAGTSADAIHVNASGGGIDIDSADTIDIDAADEITIDTTSADGHIAITSAHEVGQSILISANQVAGSILDIDAGILTVDTQGAQTLTAGGAFLLNGASTVGIQGEGTISVGTADSGTAISLGHTTSEVTVNDNLTVTGDLIVNGATTTVDTTNMSVKDQLVAINFQEGGAAGAAKDAGFLFGMGGHGTVNKSFFYDNSDGEFAVVETYTDVSGTAVAVNDYVNLKAANLEATGTLTAGGLTATHVVYAGANGVLSGEAAFKYVEGDNRVEAGSVRASGSFQVGANDANYIKLDTEDGAGGTNLRVHGAATLSGSAAGSIKFDSQGTGGTDLMAFRAATGHFALGHHKHKAGVFFDIPEFESGGANKLQIFDDDGMTTGMANADDYFLISVMDNGDTTLTTNDSDGVVGHFSVKADGDIELCASGSDITFANANRQHLNIGMSDSLTRIQNGDGQQITFEVSEGTEEVMRITDTGVDDNAALQMSADSSSNSHKIEFASTGRYIRWDNGDSELDVTSDGSINLDAATDIILDAAGNDVAFKSAGTEVGNINMASSDLTIKSSVSDKDMIFQVNDGGTPTEVFRLDGNVSALLVASQKEVQFGASTLNLANNSDGDLVLTMVAGNAFQPAVDNTVDLGAPDARFRNIYTGDLHLANERGNWTLVEESNMLTFRNNLNGKWYRMAMEEIDPTGRDEGMNGAAPVGSEGKPAGDQDWKF